LREGAKGLKFHPVGNRFSADDRRMWPAYSTAMKEGLPVLFHSGELEMVDPAAGSYGRPKTFEAILQSFPKLTVILAHLARGFLDESVAMAKKYNNLYFDISAILSSYDQKGGFTSDGHTAKVIREIGAERILFGSDWPWYDPLPGIERINRLDLTPEEKRKILGQNAARIFKLK
jgi:predicted TIM-barrel fold metal-dependent hydrolase